MAAPASAAQPPAPSRSSLDLSVLLAVYQVEDAQLREWVRRTEAMAAQLGLRAEIWLVVDGGSAAVWATVADLASEDAQVYGLRLGRRLGLHAAWQCALPRARGAWLLLLDGDLATPPELLEALWPQADPAQALVVYATPTRKHAETNREAGSRMLAQLLSTFGPAPQRGSSQKLIHHSVAQAIAQAGPPILYMDALFGVLKVRVARVPQREARPAAGSRYRKRELWRKALTILFWYTTLPALGVAGAGAVLLLLAAMLQLSPLVLFGGLALQLLAFGWESIRRRRLLRPRSADCPVTAVVPA